MENLEELVPEWLTFRTISGGDVISNNTLKGYQRDMSVWIALLAGEVGHSPTIADLEPLAVGSALSRMQTERQDSEATRRRAFITMRSFCHWLIQEGRLEVDPLQGRKPVKPPSKLPVGFEDDQMGRIIEAAQEVDPTDRSPAPLLDTAIVLLLSAAGLRASEAAEMKLRNFTHGDAPRVRVVGKGAKDRTVPITEAVADFLLEYLEWRAQTSEGKLDPSDPFLIKPDGKPLTRFVIDYRLKKVYARAGVPAPEGTVAHALRHTYAISSLNGGASVNEIQSLLGHEALSTTGIYLKAGAAHLRQAATTSAAARHLGKRR